MPRPITLNFSSPGIQPPVYIAGAWTQPPWEPLEMDVGEKRSPSGDLVFYKTFERIDEGEYQYKYRLGRGDWWALDETAETDMDSAGNKNNILRVAPAKVAEIRSRLSGETVNEMPPPQVSVSVHTFNEESSRTPSRQDENSDAPEELAMPDHNPPAQAETDHEEAEVRNAPENTSKQSSEDEPDLKVEHSTLSPSIKAAASDMPVPIVVVEKVDDEPKYGDDLGAEATSGEKVAHDLRAADAEPDAVAIVPDAKSNEPHGASASENDTDSDTSDAEPAPLFRHESMGIETDSDDDEPAPLFRHESVVLEPHQSDHQLASEDSEMAPLFRHESIYNDAEQDPWNDQGSEAALDDHLSRSQELEPLKIENGIPLFPHECSAENSPSPPRSPSRLSGPSKSGTSLQSIHEDVNDPSLEPFPMKKQDILEHIRSTERRLSKDDSVVDVTSPVIQPHSPPKPSSPSPLEVIEEDGTDDTDEGEEESKPSPPVERVTPSGLNFPPSTLNIPKDPFTPPKTPDAEKTNLNTAPPPTPSAEFHTPLMEQQASPVEADALAVPGSESTESQPAASIALPSSVALVASGAEVGEGSEPKQRNAPSDPSQPKSPARAGTPSSMMARQQAGQEGFFAAFWRVCFSHCLAPIGEWLATIFGSKKNATVSLGMMAGIAAAAVAIAYLPTG